MISPQGTGWLHGHLHYLAPTRGVCNGPEIVWDYGRNRIYVAYTDLRSNSTLPNTDVYVQYVDYNNQGMIWHSAKNGAPINAQGGGTAQFMSALAVDQASGNVAVGWYDGRSDPVDNSPQGHLAAPARVNQAQMGSSRTI